jgi:hypothetical protein
MLERFIGQFKKQGKVDIFAENEKLKSLTASYLKGEIPLEEYNKRSKDLCKFDLVRLASKLN